MSSFGSISAMITSLKNNKIKKRKFNSSYRDVDDSIVNVEPLVYKNKLDQDEFRLFSKKLQLSNKNSVEALMCEMAVKIVLENEIYWYTYEPPEGLCEDYIGILGVRANNY